MTGMRLVIGLGALAALVALFLVLRPGDDGESSGTTSTPLTAPPTAEPAPTEQETATITAPEPAGVQLLVTIRGGKPAAGIVRAEAHRGDPVLVVVRSDAVDEVHVHGYDLSADAAPGKPARIEFPARLTGRFEIELEGSGEQIAQLTVIP